MHKYADISMTHFVSRKLMGLFRLPSVTLLAAWTLSSALSAEPSTASVKYKTLPDIVFAEASGQKLMLNLHLPAEVSHPPLVVFIHGGSWRKGDRKDTFAVFLTGHGYAVASIDYRLVPAAVFPAQIFDCKAAVRWLRAHAGEYGYDATRVAAMGTSAGGHLAVLLGTSGGEKDLEGDVGGNLGQSSSVQAIVDFFGPTDFILRSGDQPELTDKESGRVYQLLGKPVRQNIDFAKLASGVFHVTPDDPPLAVFHGTADKTVLINQSHRIVEEYKSHNLPVEFHPVEGAGHGGPQFSTPECRDLVVKFLAEHFAK